MIPAVEHVLIETLDLSAWLTEHHRPEWAIQPEQGVRYYVQQLPFTTEGKGWGKASGDVITVPLFPYRTNTTDWSNLITGSLAVIFGSIEQLSKTDPSLPQGKVLHVYIGRQVESPEEPEGQAPRLRFWLGMLL